MMPFLRKCTNGVTFPYTTKQLYSSKVILEEPGKEIAKAKVKPEDDPKKIAEFILADYPAFPKEPTTCCMTGCANCVWLDYADKLTEYFEDGGTVALKEINEHVTDPSIRAYLNMEIKLRQKFK